MWQRLLIWDDQCVNGYFRIKNMSNIDFDHKNDMINFILYYKCDL